MGFQLLHKIKNDKLLHIIEDTDKMVKQIKNMRLIKQKDVSEISTNSFDNIVEGSIDGDNHIIRGVCLFGTRESANNRVYQDKAIESIARLAEGAKCYANHITKDEVKSRSGVRDIRDWVGIYEGVAKNKDAIFGNLKVRESYWDLMKDIAVMQPSGTGMSIDARVKVFSDSAGKESVVDVDALRSIDCVSQGATVSNLWESLSDKIEENWYDQELLERKVKDGFKIVMLEEGIIQDKLDNDKVKRAINDVTWTANDLIDKCLYDEKLSVADKKTKVMAIFDDLDSEIKKKMSEIKEQLTKENEGDLEMEFTLADVKANKEIMEAIINEYRETENIQKVKDSVLALEAKIAEKDGVIADKDKVIVEKEGIIEGLKKENDDAKKKLDDIAVSEAMAKREEMITRLVKEAELPDEAVTDVFKEQLRSVKETKTKDGDKETIVTVEEGMKKIIDDRKALVKKPVKKVIGSGDEFIDKTKDIKEVKEVDVDSFVKSYKGKK